MKNAFYVLLVAMVAGCSRPNNPTPKSLLGHWVLKDRYEPDGNGQERWVPTDGSTSFTIHNDSSYTATSSFAGMAATGRIANKNDSIWIIQLNKPGHVPVALEISSDATTLYGYGYCSSGSNCKLLLRFKRE